MSSLDPTQSPHIPDQSHADDPRPLMTRSEASFHASVAGARAAEAAKAQGCDPAHAAALGTAAVGGKIIGGLTFELPSAYSALAVPAISALLEKVGRAPMPLQSDCLFIAAFHKPRDVYRLAVVQGDAPAAEQLLQLANDIALQLLTRERIDEAAAWCMEAFERLNGVKKPSPRPQTTGGTNAPSTETGYSTDSPSATAPAAPAGS